MNTTNARAARLTAALLTGLSFFAALEVASAADSRLAPIQVQGMLSVDCAAPRVPGQQEIGRLFDVANFAKTYELRQQVQHITTRACHSGADRVLFARDESKPREDQLRYVAIND